MRNEIAEHDFAGHDNMIFSPWRCALTSRVEFSVAAGSLQPGEPEVEEEG
jgi:hypothetical protein